MSKAIAIGLVIAIISGAAVDSQGWAGWVAAVGFLAGLVLATWGMRKEER